MKKSDIAMIVLIASVSVLVAFFAAKAIFPSASNGTARVDTIERIDSQVIDPSPDIFNKNAINPTYQVEIKEAE